MSASLYTPPSERGTITSPSVLGGVEWQGGSYDPYTNILYVNSNNVASISQLKKNYETTDSSNLTNMQLGNQIYLKNCASCHGLNRSGVPPTYPSVIHLNKTKEEIASIIANGKNIMPAFSQFTTKDLNAITDFIMSNDTIANMDILPLARLGEH